MRLAILCILAVLFPGRFCLAEPPAPYDRIRSVYEPYMPMDDPHAFAMKCRALSQSPFGFWRGAKDLFFAWAADNCRDFMEDKASYVTQQGDPHFGNVGTYLTDKALGDLGFGLVDFDDSFRGPFQLEVLQGMITLRLAARENKITLTDNRFDEINQIIFDNYRMAAASSKTATDLLRDDPLVMKLIVPKRKQHYAKELERYTKGDRFLPAVATRKSDVKDLMRPARQRAEEFAPALAEMLARSPELRGRLRYSDEATLRRAIKDVALRTRPGSSGSQGLEKFFVLLDKPLRDADHDAILYLKEQIPTAAERSGLVPRDGRPPGRRIAEDIVALTHPGLFFSGWCQVGRKTYWVTMREPWTLELDEEDIKTLDDLKAYSRLWAIAAGATHRGEGEAKMIAEKLDRRLLERLEALSRQFVAVLERDYARFVADERVIPLVRQANAVIEKAR